MRLFWSWLTIGICIMLMLGRAPAVWDERSRIGILNAFKSAWRWTQEVVSLLIWYSKSIIPWPGSGTLLYRTRVDPPGEPPRGVQIKPQPYSELTGPATVLSPLLTPFEGWLKHHKPTMNNIWGEGVFKLVFPSFDPPVWTPEKMAKARAEASPNIDHLLFQPAQHRRWGGYELPRGRYYSVAKNEKGIDNGTLTAELRAYRDLREQGMIVDVLDATQIPALNNPPVPESIRAVLEGCVVVNIFPATRLRSR